MTNKDVIRAWKDPEYRNSLSKADRSLVPAHPAGLIEISDADLGKVTGALRISTVNHCTNNSLWPACCS